MADTTKREEPKTKAEEPRTAAFDERGHLPETNVANKEQLHVHSGQIIDKQTSVLQTIQDAPVQSDTTPQEILRAAQPTGADVPGLTKDDFKPAPASGRAKSSSPQSRPENNARSQAANETAKYSIGPDSFNAHGKLTTAGPVGSLESPTEHPIKAGIDDRAVPGARTGNPLQMLGENQLGEKAFDIAEDGSHWLMVLNKDKSRAFSVTGEDSDLANTDYTDIQKLRVEIKFPSINPKVSQRHLLVLIDQYQPCEMYFPPDVSHVQIIVPKNLLVHAEMRHIDADGNESPSYVVDFYSNPSVTPKPLEASPLGAELMGDVIVRVEQALSEMPKPVQGEFGRTAGGSPLKPATGEAKTLEDTKKAEAASKGTGTK